MSLCMGCRQGHLKCDAARPICMACTKSGKVCLYPAEKSKDIFRHGMNPSRQIRGEPSYGERDLAFSRDQTWVDIPSDLAFEDNTEEIISNYFGSSDYRLTPGMSLSEGPELSSLPADDETESPLNSISTLGNGNTVLGVLFGAAKLNNVTEGYLLRHFGRVIGPWLDICDDDRHFTFEVVHRAPTCPLLLNACLALAARQLANTTDFSPETADYYHGRCIEILIPLLGEPDLHQEMDAILASVVILRLEEQISCVKHEHDFQHHLSGGSAFFNSGIDWYVAGGLAEASFWAFAVQDIQFSLAWQTSLRLCFEKFNDGLERMWLSQPLLTEKQWAHRAIWLLAETAQYCLADQGDKSKKEWERIDGKLDEWEKSRPEAFAPFFYRAADPGAANPLPTIWFTSPLHVSAIQYICMAKAILITCDPSRPKLGLNCGKFQRRQQERVLEYLKVLFGAAASCKDAAARHMIPICLCASYYWISDRNLQRQILDLVNVVGEETGWFWNAIIDDIKLEWAW